MHDFLMPFILFSFFIVLFALERIFPLRNRTSPQLYRLFINLLISLFVFVVAFFIIAPLAEYLLGFSSRNSIGLFNIVELPSCIELVLTVLLLDLSFYYWHRLNHEVPLLWRFHNIHHIDPDLDVSTSFRFHFVEIFYSTGFRVFQILLIGAAPLSYLIYVTIFEMGTIFHHSNLRIPIFWERLLNKVIVTPRMHGIHHSIVREETNSNYSVIFRWWDIFHKTIRLNISQKNIRIGVPAYSMTDNKFKNLLVLPFQQQKNYWHFPDGKVSVRKSEKREDKNHLLS